MAAIKQAIGARTSLAASGFATLASATYVASGAYAANVNQPVDVIVEVDAATTNIPAGNKQLVAFISDSLDGVNFRSGPASGTSTTDEPNLRLLGILPMATASTPQIGTFSVFNALGYIPHSFKVILKNDLGVALTAGTVWTSEVSNTVA